MDAQVKAILWKNWLLKVRHPWRTFCEIMLPSTIMLALMIVRTRVDVEFHPEAAYVKKEMFVQVGRSEISPSFDDFLKFCFSTGGHLALAPDNTETRAFLGNLSLRFPLLKVVAKLFANESALEAYIRSNKYGSFDTARNVTNPNIKAAIVFHEQGPFVYDYSIRLNHSWAFSGFPDVQTIMATNGPYVNDLQLGLNLLPTLQYGYSGFLTLQQLVDSYITIVNYHSSSKEIGAGTKIDDGSAAGFEEAKLVMLEQNKMNSLWEVFKPIDISIAAFPTRKYTDDEFQSIVKSVMGILYLLGFLYPISQLISNIVLEKERKIKEGMQIMGLKEGAFYRGWLFTYMIQMGVSCMIITLLTMNSIFAYSDKSAVFVYFYLFGVSAILLSFVITTFFSRAKTAVTVGILSFLGAYFPYFTVVDSNVSMPVKLLASLLSPTAFALGTVNFADYEQAQIGIRWTNIWKGSSGVNLMLCLFMMILDTVLYAGVGWYLSKVLPSEYGISYPWNFLFTRNYWQGGVWGSSTIPLGKEEGLNSTCYNSNEGIKSISFENADGEHAFESVPLQLQQQELEGRCVQLRKLTKVYTKAGEDCFAVQDLDLTLYESQVLVLLGHNGAGKSTTISMLVGLVPPTSGDALVLGKSIHTDMNKIRRELGLCPQSDILFPELTVKEHLQLFGIIKGIDSNMKEHAVDSILSDVGLADKVDSLVSTLSGGMKRKLSLAIALLGDSKVIVLDEPTSGMDPHSMRITWQLIKRLKKGKVILLSTHSMNEAEVLGDRIAIMANGSLRCCGRGHANLRIFVQVVASCCASCLYLKRVRMPQQQVYFSVTLADMQIFGFSSKWWPAVVLHVYILRGSLFLKHCYGVGYTLTLVKGSESCAIADMVLHHVPSATLLSDAASEISFRLPHSSSPAFKRLFEDIESHLQSISLYSDELENESLSNDHSLLIKSYGVSVTTLEEVFIKVAEEDYGSSHIKSSSSTMNEVDDEHEGSDEDLYHKEDGDVGTQSVHFLFRVRFYCFWSTICAFFHKKNGRFSTITASNEAGANEKKGHYFWKHFKALVKKRAICARRDKRSILFQLVIPPFFMLIGFLLLILQPHPDQPSLLLTTKYFNPLLGGGGGGGPIPFNLTLPLSQQVASHIHGGWVEEEHKSSYRFPDADRVLADAVIVAGPVLGPTLISMSEYLMSSLNLSYQSRYGAVVWEESTCETCVGYTVMYNSTCQHAGPTYINVVNNAILVSATGNLNMTIQTRNHPLPQSPSQFDQRHDLNAFSAAVIVTIAFSFIPASFAVPIVKEREVKAKHQQLISGVSVIAYWTSTYAWDAVSYLVPASIAFVLFSAFGMHQFISWNTFPSTFSIMVLYGPAVAASTYCLTFFFNDYSTAQNAILLIHFFTGLVLMVTSFIMSFIPATEHVNLVLKNIFRLSPTFCLADGLAALALRRQSFKSTDSEQPWDWNITGGSVCYLILEVIIYFVIVLILEVAPVGKTFFWCLQSLQNKCNPRSGCGAKFDTNLKQPLLSTCSMTVEEEDMDVEAERKAVLSGVANNSMVRLVNLRKVYVGSFKREPKIAVHSLSFCVREGECFGFLGVNGAGKTTTLSILSGEEAPTDGDAFIMGNSVCSNRSAARRMIGYCPQFDPLLELLTPREHLQLYARIKAVPDEILNEVVEAKLREFDLWSHADKNSVALSGGNKRKLSVAIAMIGEPPIVVLDEPSSGMDPVGKRFMWNVISNITGRCGKSAVILTTHSMDEAQALCTRIGIMVGGRLCCLGSPQHLKSRFGSSLELEVKYIAGTSTEVETLCRMLYAYFSRNPQTQSSFIGTGDVENITSHVYELSLSKEMVISACEYLQRESRDYHAHDLFASTSGNVLSTDIIHDQLTFDEEVPMKLFCDRWLARDRMMKIDHFVRQSFQGASLLECNGYNIHYQIPCGSGVSISNIFGHLEDHRKEIGIAEYSLGQSTLETIFNYFASAHLTI